MPPKQKTKTEDVKKLVYMLETAAAFMASQVRNEDILIFLGTTKSGKSSLINYLLGNELIGVQEGFSPIKLLTRNKSGPVIGERAASETIVPTRWSNLEKLPGLTLWDAPGFDDNRGSEQDIANAFYIYELFKNVRSIRIALVVQIDHIATDPINSFLSLLRSLENLLRSRMRDCFSSIVLVISQVPSTLYGQRVSVEAMINLLERKIIRDRSIGISDVGRDFIEHIIKNPRQIALFMQANLGKVDDSIDRGATEAILDARSVDSAILKDVVCPSLSEQSQSFLFRARGDLSSMKSFKKLIEIVKRVFDDRLNMFNEIQGSDNNDKLHHVKAELIVIRNEIERLFDPRVSFQSKISLLQRLDPRIENQINEADLIKKSKLIVFVDKLLNLQEAQEFDLCMEQILKQAQSEIEKLTLAVEMKLGEISQNEYQEKVKDMQAKCEIEIKTLNSQLEDVRKHNNNVAGKLGFFGYVGHTVDRGIEVTGEAIKSGMNYVVSFFK